MNRGSLTIRDREFEVIASTLTAKGRESSELVLSVHTKGVRYDGEMWEPMLYGEGISIPRFKERLMRGAVFEVAEAYDMVTQEPLFCLYVFTHNSACKNRIEVLEITASEIKVRWTGFCDVHWGDDYDENLPFCCETWLDIKYENQA